MLPTKYSIGLDALFKDLEQLTATFENNNYPPYNLYKTSETTYMLELALAGFDKSNISIELKNNHLVITGEEKSSKKEVTYIHKGISSKKFARSFVLDKHIEVTSATFDKGILSIELTKYTPDYLKPKIITIS
jgi:molecular chaperone IbpA